MQGAEMLYLTCFYKIIIQWLLFHLDLNVFKEFKYCTKFQMVTEVHGDKSLCSNDYFTHLECECPRVININC